jgi:hypothetical protein
VVVGGTTSSVLFTRSTGCTAAGTAGRMRVQVYQAAKARMIRVTVTLLMTGSDMSCVLYNSEKSNTS